MCFKAFFLLFLLKSYTGETVASREIEQLVMRDVGVAPPEPELLTATLDKEP